MKDVIIGDTVKVTWVSSGVTPTTLYAALFSGSETLISSVSMTSSGNGHYYANITIPDTPGYYASETKAVINGFPYIRKLKMNGVTGEVD